MAGLAEKNITQTLSIGTINISIMQYAKPRDFFICNAHRDAFTLIELIIVIFIISLTTALVMPNLWGTGERALKAEAKRIGSTLRYVNDEAAGKKRTYVFKIDLTANSWGFESEKESRSFEMKNNTMVKDIMVPSLGTVSFGEVLLEFGPLGAEEPVTLHLMKDKYEYTVIFNHINGRAEIYKGYIL